MSRATFSMSLILSLKELGAKTPVCFHKSLDCHGAIGFSGVQNLPRALPPLLDQVDCILAGVQVVCEGSLDSYLRVLANLPVREQQAPVDL